jgi:lysophospholipase L1-like esterase
MEKNLAFIKSSTANTAIWKQRLITTLLKNKVSSTLIVFSFLTIFLHPAFAQTTIVNYNFNSGNSYGTLAPALASNISCLANGSSTFATAGGTATGGYAFTSNSSGNAQKTSVNSSRTFTITGSNLAGYKTFKIYYQAEKTSIGSNNITVSYSKDGAAFTTSGVSSSVGGNPLSLTTLLFPSWKEAQVTLPVKADNPINSLVIKLSVDNNSNGSILLDNFQVQAQASLQVTGFSGNTLCAGSTGQLTMTASGGTNPYTVVYSDGVANRTATGVISATPFNVYATPSVTKTYTLVSVTDAKGFIKKSGFTDATATLSPNPVPTVNSVASQTICNNGTTAAVNFTSAVSGTTFNWSYNIPLTGASGSGSGNIAPFTYLNTAAVPLVGNFTVTPVANGCTGASKTFSITVNPSPTTALAGSAQTINNATTTKLSANTPLSGTGKWSVVSGPSVSLIQFSNTADPLSGFTPAAGTGIYNLRWTISTATCGSSSSNVAVTVITGASNLLPVAKAGADTSLIIPSSSLILNGSASSDADGTITSYLWKQINATNTSNIVSPGSSLTTVSNLSEGIYDFELTVTDNKSATARDTVRVTVGTRLLIDAGASLTTSPDNGGKFWNNMTDAGPGVRVQNAITTTNLPSSITLEVVNRIDGTYDVTSTGLGGGNTTGAVGDYPSTATSDFAFAHSSTVNGNWKFTGLDPLKQYTIKFWGTKSAADRYTQIKRSDETFWQEYDAGNNTDFNRAAVFTFSGKTAMSFDIRVKDGYTFGYVNVVDITRTAGQPYTPPAATDSDIVNCGKPFTIAVLGSSTAYGNGATPIDSSWVNKFTGYVKRKNATSSVINFGVPGFTTYDALCPDGFQPPANRPSPSGGNNITAAVNLHPDAIIINLPTNDAANGYTLAEQQANYERTMHIADSAHIPVWVTTTQPRNNLTTVQVSNLQQMRDWIYTRFGNKAVDFWSTVANADGTIVSTYNYDGIHVNNAGHDIFYRRILAETILDTLCNSINALPVAKAGNDSTIIIPANTITLNGSSSSDADGTITNYQWSKIAGPAGYVIDNTVASVTTVSNLSDGIYSFVLKVTDNKGASATDTIQIIVANRILVDAGSNELTLSPDVLGKYWNNMTDAGNGIRVQNAITTGNIPTNINLEVVNRIDGTYDISGTGLGGANTIGAVGDYPETATNDFAYAHTSTVNGNWKFTGLDPLKQYTIKFWGAKSAADRFTQIKRSDETNWQEYDAGFNTDYNRAATFIFSGKTEMSFDIRVKDGYTFGYINVVDISMVSLTSSGARYVNNVARPALKVMPNTNAVIGSLKMYPNPSDGNIKIAIPETGKSSPATILISNSFGQQVYKNTITNSGGLITLNLSGKLSNGIYMVNCIVNGKQTTQKIIVNK